MTPEMPPMVNIAMRPIANFIGTVNRISPRPHRGDPVEDLHAGRDGDEHRHRREDRVGDRGHAHGEHVVGPDAEAEEADGMMPE
jgi:hypothetical protein